MRDLAQAHKIRGGAAQDAACVESALVSDGVFLQRAFPMIPDLPFPWGRNPSSFSESVVNRYFQQSCPENDPEKPGKAIRHPGSVLPFMKSFQRVRLAHPGKDDRGERRGR